MVVLRFSVTDGADEAELLTEAGEALAALAACPGYQRGQLGRAVDEPSTWCLVTEWATVGAYRRALGSYDVKLRGTPFLARALPEASAFEPLLRADPGGAPQRLTSDLARDDHAAREHGQASAGEGDRPIAARP